MGGPGLPPTSRVPEIAPPSSSESLAVGAAIRHADDMPKLLAALVSALLAMAAPATNQSGAGSALGHSTDATSAAAAAQEPEDEQPLFDALPNGVLRRLHPTELISESAGAWRAPHVIRRVRAIAWDQVWLKDLTTPRLEPVNVRAKGVYQVGPEAELLLLNDTQVHAVDIDGSLWRLPMSSRLSHGEWVRMGPGKAIALHDGTLWGINAVKDADACNTKLRRNYATIELVRTEDSRTTTLPCDTLPDLRPDPPRGNRGFKAAAAPAGVLYLAGAVADPEEPDEPFRNVPGLFRIDGSGWQKVRPPIEYDDSKLVPAGLWVTPSETLWMSWTTEANGATFARLDGEEWTTFDVTIDQRSGLAGKRGWEEHDDRFSLGPDGRAWLAAGSGLLLFDGAAPREVLSARGLHSVSVAPDGTIWVGAGDVLLQFPADWLVPSAPLPEAPDPWPAVFLIAIGIAAAMGIGVALRWRRLRCGN